MRRGFVAFFALSLVGVGLTGCGLFRFEQREPWRAQAEEACLAQRLVQPSAYMALSSKIDGPGVCGMDHPFKVAAFTNGSVGLKSKVTLACPIIPRIDTWLDEIVKPAAMMYFGVPVVDVKAGSYSCRPRNNQRGAKVSEHAFGNALDVMAFILADGREIRSSRAGRATRPSRNSSGKPSWAPAGISPRSWAPGPIPSTTIICIWTWPGTIPGATGGSAGPCSNSNRGSTRSRAGLRRLSAPSAELAPIDIEEDAGGGDRRRIAAGSGAPQAGCGFRGRSSAAERRLCVRSRMRRRRRLRALPRPMRRRRPCGVRATSPWR